MKRLLLLATLLAPSLAHADDEVAPTTDAPAAATTDAPAAEPPVAPAKPKRKRFYVRAGVAHIAPLEQSREMELSDVDGPASLALMNGPIAGSGASVSSATIPGIIVGYVLPVGNDKLSVETILGLPFTVTFHATGTLATDSLAPTALGLPTGVPPLGSDLGTAKAVPIVATLVYQVAQLGKVTPYVGAGPSIMFATNEKVTNMQLTAVAEPQMSIAPAPGLVLQAGIDAMITKRIYARLDVKFIAFMLARATVEHVQVKTPDLPLFDNVEVGTAKMSMWLNPLVLQAGIGTDF
ncbi:MAG TPA: OmpW family outer membrane protein [Kofleriaceae bacterium]|nr:OmpW family outer membrane protein [Kofleriaceae bacterium]